MEDDMTRETLTALNTETLIGFTDKRGHAWHYREQLQGGEPNHYPGPIPAADVRRRLFHWDVVSSRERWTVPADAATATGIDEDGRPIRTVVGTDQVLFRSDKPEVKLGTASEDYEPHPYRDTLLDGLASILTPDGLAVTSDSLRIGSAGILRGGRQAWVQIETPDNITTAEGVAFRPTILAATSLDKSLQTTFCSVETIVVCDNTRDIALSEADRTGHQFKIKHRKGSLSRLRDARQVLGIITEDAEKFAAEIAELCQIPITDQQFDMFLSEVAPLTSDAPATRTKVGNLRDQLHDLYDNDERVSPWRKTTFGLVQMMNTYTQHLSPIKKTTYRPARNIDQVIRGKVADSDNATFDAIDKVLVMSS